MKRVRLLTAVAICLVTLFVFTGCGLLGGLGNLDFKDYDYFKSKTKNYSMRIVDGDTVTIIKTCEDGYLYQSDNSIFFYNNKTKKGYQLDAETHTGVEHTYEDGANFYNIDNAGFIDMLYAFQYMKLFMKKGGSEKVAGRACTIYTFSSDGEQTTFWLDNEFGMCLKMRTTDSEGAKDTMEVTEFTLGSVTVNNMINLSQYSITNGDLPQQ